MSYPSWVKTSIESTVLGCLRNGRGEVTNCADFNHAALGTLAYVKNVERT